MTRIDATISYLAEALRYFGDTDNEDRRRTKAVLLLANPLQALQLMQALKTARSHTAQPDAAPATTAADGARRWCRGRAGGRHPGPRGTRR